MEELWAGTDLWRVDAVQAAYGNREWHRLSAGAGSKGERWYDWQCWILAEPEGADWGHYLLFRRACTDAEDWQAYAAFAPQGCDLETLVGVAGRCWCIEHTFEVAKQVDMHFPQAEKVVLVCDNLNTHHSSVPCEALAPAEARRHATRLAWHYTPKHGSWLNIAEIEFVVLAAQCLDRRIESETVLRTKSAAWVQDRNALGKPVNWQFTTEDARIKLLHLYPAFE